MPISIQMPIICAQIKRGDLHTDKTVESVDQKKTKVEVFYEDGTSRLLLQVTPTTVCRSVPTWGDTIDAAAENLERSVAKIVSLCNEASTHPILHKVQARMAAATTPEAMVKALRYAQDYMADLNGERMWSTLAEQIKPGMSVREIADLTMTHRFHRIKEQMSWSPSTASNGESMKALAHLAALSEFNADLGPVWSVEVATERLDLLTAQGAGRMDEEFIAD